MSEVTYEEVRRCLAVVYEEDEEYYNTENLEDRATMLDNAINGIDRFIEQHRPPTFDEVVKAWEDNERLKVRESKDELEVYSGWSGKVYFAIFLNDYNPRVWISPSMTPYHKAITIQQLTLLNLTIQYLQAQKENE